ncbi:hypothetical protein [Hoeflea ulvae]|uniref:Uncharacterized protein n=1 Tax=Hoeflea ulvae TaxID=2983764 RepID=A0ABT3YBI6_9HYPH|nr:hypothetical protein [Hoeflea ulvae]MCY0093250.1 hypothetical protein [Hoeflea ulvae]
MTVIKLLFTHSALIRLFPLIAALFLIPVTAFAQTDSPVLELANVPDFNERYAGNTQVNGQFLSGLAYSGPITQGALDDLRLGLLRQSEAAPATICVRVMTDDGRYWAANMYRAAGGFSAPPKVPVHTRYAEQLSMYGSDSLLLLATLSENCNDFAGKTYVPAIIGAKRDAAGLLAYVNVSQSRVEARLQIDDQEAMEKVKCKKPIGGARVTYSHICDIPVTETMRGKALHLVISVRGLTGTTTEQRYAVHVE